MALSFETRRYRLTGTERLMGSQPANKELRTEFVASKAISPIIGEQEDALMPNIDEKGLTVFLRGERGNLVMLNYMIRGYFKGALEALIAQTGVKLPRGKVDRYLTVKPRIIPIKKNGELVYEPEYQCERPLRAETMQGPRVALTSSETVDAPWTLEFEVTLFPNTGTKSSNALTWDDVEMALDYGNYQGLGQWRNGGNGTFTWERVDTEGK